MPFYLTIPWGGGTGEPSSYLIPRPAGNWATTLSSLGSIINALMPYIFAITGIILLFMIIFSGYSLLTSAGNPEGIEKGKKRLTAALTGFIIIFAAFWIWQLVSLFLGRGIDFTG
jgi:hypothetical protein